MSFRSSRTSAWKLSVSLGVSFVLGVVMAPADCGRRNQNSSPSQGLRESARADGGPDGHRGVFHVVPAGTHEVVDFVPEQQESFHRDTPLHKCLNLGAIVGT